MQSILRGFTMFIANQDFGIDIAELEIPIPAEVTDDVRSGGMDLAVAVSLGALEALECKIKMLGQSPDIQQRIGLAPGVRETFTFRGASVNEMDGKTSEHVVVIEGKLAEGSRDAWGRGERSGTDYTVKGIMYYRYEVDRRVIHEIQAWPSKRIVNGVDQLAAINSALGRI